jgi:hypothetical protein
LLFFYGMIPIIERLLQAIRRIALKLAYENLARKDGENLMFELFYSMTWTYASRECIIYYFTVLKNCCMATILYNLPIKCELLKHTSRAPLSNCHTLLKFPQNAKQNHGTNRSRAEATTGHLRKSENSTRCAKIKKIPAVLTFSQKLPQVRAMKCKSLAWS